MSALMCDLLQQLDFIYSLQDMNSTPCTSFKNITPVTSFTSLGNGLAMFLILDEVLANIDHTKNYLSPFYKQVAELIGSCAALLQLRTPSDAEHVLQQIYEALPISPYSENLLEKKGEALFVAISRKAALHEMIRKYGQAVKDLPRLISVLEKQAHDKYNQSRTLARPVSPVNDLTETHLQLSSIEEEAKNAVPLDMYLTSLGKRNHTKRSLYDLEETRNSRKRGNGSSTI
ncbi:hypothetical protein MKX03_001999 [Papaver bracteatum]|nr:hypothetical protein MKX03_001999 [Papaver bracteatum]